MKMNQFMGGRPGKIDTPFPIMCQIERKRRVSLIVWVLMDSKRGRNQMVYQGA